MTPRAKGRPTVKIETIAPAGHFVVDSAAVTLLDGDDEAPGEPLTMPSAAFIRLVCGRLDPDHMPAAVVDHPALPALRACYTGF